MPCELYFNIVVKTNEGFKKNKYLRMTRRGEAMTKDVNTFLEDGNPGEEW